MGRYGGGCCEAPLPLCLQGTALECSFGLEESFEAVWVNASLVGCNQVVVSGLTLAGHTRGPLYLLPSSPCFFSPPSFPRPHPSWWHRRPHGKPRPHPCPSLVLTLQLHTTQKSQVFPLNLKLKGPPDRFLDSPNPMTGECPNCPTMGETQPWGGVVTGSHKHHTP